MDEVLSQQSAEVQEFLVKTSVLDQLSGPLCDAVTLLGDQVCDGRAHLEWLERSNLFVIALDSQQEWYRYHHLFQMLLQNRLQRQYDKEQIADLHRRASAWYAENNLVDESIVHALAAGDELAAMRVVATHRYDAMNREQWQQIDRWLRMLPRRLIDEQPELLLLEVWKLQRLWRFSDLPALLERIDALIELEHSGERCALPARRNRRFAQHAEFLHAQERRHDLAPWPNRPSTCYQLRLPVRARWPGCTMRAVSWRKARPAAAAISSTKA